MCMAVCIVLFFYFAKKESVEFVIFLLRNQYDTEWQGTFHSDKKEEGAGMHGGSLLIIIVCNYAYSAAYQRGSPALMNALRVKSPLAGSVNRSSAVPSNVMSVVNLLPASTKSEVM